MTEFLQQHILSGWTPGAVGIWTLVASCIGLWWKGLPAVIDAFDRRQSGIEVRTVALMDDQAKRFAEQLAQADARHDECMEGQKKLRAEMVEMRQQYSELWGMYRAMQQGAQSAHSVVAKAIKDARDET